jgi:hypothetical protein
MCLLPAVPAPVQKDLLTPVSLLVLLLCLVQLPHETASPMASHAALCK